MAASSSLPPIRRPGPAAAYARFCERPLAPLILVAAVALLAAWASGFVLPAVPRVHDEFSYLLQADTLLHGRLANPPHPLWRHFETFHVLHAPTYASKYPLLQGAFLALGRLVGGSPVVGVWISFALACAATTWMARSWLPAGWALWAGLVPALSAQLAMRWGSTFWGGAPAMLGGALVLGAARRLADRAGCAEGGPRARDAAVLACGAWMLATSRMYEGLVLCALVFGALAWTLLLRRDAPRAATLRRALPAFLAVVVLMVAFLGWYHYRLTGDPLTMPHVLHEQQYMAVPHFLFLPRPPEPEYNDVVVQLFYTRVSAPPYDRAQTLDGFLSTAGEKLLVYGRFFPGRVLALALVGLPWALRDRWLRFALVALGVVALALVVETYVGEHYAAPVTPLVAVVVMAGLRELSRRRVGRVLAILIVAGSLVDQGLALGPWLERSRRSSLNERPRVESELRALGGKHLVFVRYSTHHDINQEWVFNDADIDAADVVWARELDAVNPRGLIAHMPDRRVWVVQPDEPGAPRTPLADGAVR